MLEEAKSGCDCGIHPEGLDELERFCLHLFAHISAHAQIFTPFKIGVMRARQTETIIARMQV